MRNKLVVVFCLCLLMFSLLYLRIGSICFDNSLLQAGVNQSSYTLSFSQSRGQIYDCRLIPLVDNERSYIASILPTPQNILELTQNMVIRPKTDITELIKNGKPFLTESTLPKVNIPQVDVFSVPKRYQQNQLAKHLIGYIDPSSNKGLTGIERACDAELSANSESSKISYLLNGLGQTLIGEPPSVSLAPIRSDGVVLTIDKRIQSICEQVGAVYLKKGAIVVMNPYTGELKAAVSFPTYDTDNLTDAIADEENSPLLNRAFCAYNVGSTFKLTTAAAALSQGVSEYTEFYCNGQTKVGDVVFGCHDKSGHGKIAMAEAIAVSCNPYFINLSALLDKQKFLNMASDLSFGKNNELAEGMYSAKGNIPTLEELFNPAAVGNLSFGQGSLTATPVQVAQMVSSIINDGETMPVTLVKGYTQDGKLVSKSTAPKYPIKAMDKWIATKLKNYMITAVMDTPNQNAKPVNTTAGGKTGTAQTGVIKADGEELLQGWFAGFYPADKPQYVIAIVSEDAKSGNQDASPIFKMIVDALTAPLEVPQRLR